VRGLFTSEATLVLSIGLAACQQASPPEPIAAAPISDSSFHSCVDREVKAAVNRTNEKNDLAIYGYHTEIENDIISICDPQLRRETVQDNLISSNPVYSYLNTAIEAQTQALVNEKIQKEVEEKRKQADLDAPRIKAEKAEETDAGAAYLVCLERHAKTLSLNSNEPAEIIVQASFPSCLSERQTVFDVYHRHNNYFSEGAMNVAEDGFRRTLLLEVIKARTRPSAQPAPPPAKPETPI
jgi:hypothetical protein